MSIGHRFRYFFIRLAIYLLKVFWYCLPKYYLNIVSKAFTSFCWYGHKVYVSMQGLSILVAKKLKTKEFILML